MNKCIAFILEGETELEFYKKLVAYVHDIHPNKKFDCDIMYKCLKGVGGFKNEALRYFIKELKTKYSSDTSFVIVFCSDTDVFEFQKNPPLDWKNVIQNFYDKGAGRVIHIEAKHCIEDWFLYDEEGIRNFLRLPKLTKIPKGDGYHSLQELHKKVSKVYYKGMRSNGLISKLDLSVIVSKTDVANSLEPLYKELGINIVDNK